MDSLNLMITISGRSQLAGFLEMYRSLGIGINMVSLGKGTVKNETSDYFGLENDEKAACFSFVTADTWPKVKELLVTKVRIDAPNMGIVFTVPVASVSGKRELAYFTDGQKFEKGDESSMKDTDQQLLVVISNQGRSSEVMDAARDAGARGGTVIHAVGTGVNEAERFLGVSLGSEKDLIFIVTSTKDKNTIMSSISEKAGLDTPAQAVIFSLPVTDTAGMKLS